MKSDNGKNIKIIVFIVAIVVAATALSMGISLLCGNLKFDVTADNRYSLSEETMKFLEENQKDIAIRLYKDVNLSKKSPKLGKYGEYVQRLLGKYVDKSNGKITLSVIETVPFASTQAEAEKAGVKEFELPNKEKYAYLGAVFTDEEGRSMTIPRLGVERYGEVEADVTRLLSVLAKDKKAALGVISPFFRVANAKNPLQYAENYPFIKQLQENGYEIVLLREETPYIPYNVDAVLLFYPLNLSNLTVFALDQYLMRGGRVIVIMDAFSDRRFVRKKVYKQYQSGLDKFLQNNGIVYQNNMLVGDERNAKELVLDGQKINYPLKPIIDGEKGEEKKINNGLKNLYLSHAGFFEYDVGENLKVKELLSVENSSGEMPAAAMVDMDYDELLKNYLPTGKKYSVAILAEGKFVSMFDKPLIEDAEMMLKMPPFLSVPLKEGKLLLIGDSDMFSADLWDAKYKEKHGAYEAVFISDNMRFLLKAVDYMTESGYVTLTAKAGRLSLVSVAQVLRDKAMANYAKQKEDSEKKLMQIRQNMAIIGDKTKAKGLTTIAQFKEMEELQRAEMAENRNLEQIEYLINKKYQSYLDWLAWMLIVVIPLGVAAAIWGIYYAYELGAKRKAREYVK